MARKETAEESGRVQLLNGSPILWRVRVCLPGSIIHLTSLTEPEVHMFNGRVHSVRMELVTAAPDSGDTVGFIDWPAVVALTWRPMKLEPTQ
jgi:hypothetical protein